MIQRYHFSIDDDYLFDNFISINTNVEAKQKAYDFAHTKNPGKNIVVISGAVGIGKTYLAYAILNETKSSYPNANVLSASFESLINMNQTEIDEVLNIGYLNTLSLFLIDSFFENNLTRGHKLRSRLYNLFHQINTKIVITIVNDDIAIEHDRITVITPPTGKEIMAILKPIFNKEHIEINVNTEKVREFIYNNKWRSVREVHGYLSGLIALCQINKVEMNLNLAEERYYQFAS